MSRPAPSKQILFWAIPLGLVWAFAVMAWVSWSPRPAPTPRTLGVTASRKQVESDLTLNQASTLVEARAPVETARTAPSTMETRSGQTGSDETKSMMSGAPLSGTLQVWDASGLELPAGNGWIKFTIHRGMYAAHHRARVVDGEWSIECAQLLGCDRLTIAAVWTHDRPAVLIEEFELNDLPESRTIELRARQIESTVLRVLDAATGLDLDDVSIARSRGFGVVHPGMDVSSRLVVAGQRSPLSLPQSLFGLEFGRMRTIFSVGASGYAWQLVDVDFESGGEQRVYLESAGSLIVGIEGVDREADAELRLTLGSRQEPSAIEKIKGDGRIEVSRLAPGEYRVRVEVGPWYENPIVLGETNARVVAGESAKVTLELEHAPESRLTTASGLVLVHSAWERQHLTGSLNLIGTSPTGSGPSQQLSLIPTASPRSGFDAFSWQASDLQAGAYVMEIYSPAYKALIEVSELGQQHSLVEVPCPVELVVHLIDSFTGLPVQVENVHWQPVLPAGVGGTVRESARSGDKTGQYLIRTPAVPISVHVMDWSYQRLDLELEVSRLSRPLTLGLTPAVGFTLRLMDGETEVPLPGHWTAYPVPAEGTTGLAGMSSGSHFGRRFQVSEPGIYTIVPVTPQGYVELQPLRIEVFANYWQVVEVPLVRKVP